VVWQWQRNRGREGRNPELRVVPGPAGSDGISQTPSAAVNPLLDPEFVSGLRPIASAGSGGQATWSASDIVGVRPSGEPVSFRIDEHEGAVLVAFLATRCDGCDEFWRGFRDRSDSELPAGVSAVVVTKGPTSLATSDVELAAAGINSLPVIMSDEAWNDYRVMGYPFFVLVDARGVVGETVGFGWSDVLSMIRSAGH
jgi:hypothetical protein